LPPATCAVISHDMDSHHADQTDYSDALMRGLVPRIQACGTELHHIRGQSAAPHELILEVRESCEREPGKAEIWRPLGICTQFAAEFSKIKPVPTFFSSPIKVALPPFTACSAVTLTSSFTREVLPPAYFKEGKLKALVVTSESRGPELPDGRTASMFS
jgi:hypothetical protein